MSSHFKERLVNPNLQLTTAHRFGGGYRSTVTPNTFVPEKLPKPSVILLCVTSCLFSQRELLDLSTVDVILISNYHCMMALPYITEHTGFSGTVYATEPTFQIGR